MLIIVMYLLVLVTHIALKFFVAENSDIRLISFFPVGKNCLLLTWKNYRFNFISTTKKDSHAP